MDQICILGGQMVIVKAEAHGCNKKRVAGAQTKGVENGNEEGMLK